MKSDLVKQAPAVHVVGLAGDEGRFSPARNAIIMATSWSPAPAYVVYIAYLNDKLVCRRQVINAECISARWKYDG